MMAHMSEKTWSTVSDEANRKLEKLLQFLVEGDAIYLKMLELWKYHQGDVVNVARQLFATDQPTSEELAKLNDLKEALLAVHQIYTSADNEPRVAAIRRMA